MFVAIKNGENKGVYRKSDFRYEWRVKGVQIKNFKSPRLREALQWVGVSDVKGATSDEIIKKKNKWELKKDNKELIVCIMGVNKKHMSSLKLMISELESASKFVKTPFYLDTEEYKSNLSQSVEVAILEKMWVEYDIAHDYLEYINECLMELRDELRLKESEFKDYQSYLEWKITSEGVAYQEHIKLKLDKIIKDRKYKSHIVSLIKTYNANKKIFHENQENPINQVFN